MNAAVRFHRRASRHSAAEDRQHSRDLLDSGIQSGVIGRGDNSQIARQKDLILEFANGTERNRQVARELRTGYLATAFRDVGCDGVCRPAHLIDERPVASPVISFCDFVDPKRKLMSASPYVEFAKRMHG